MGLLKSLERVGVAATQIELGLSDSAGSLGLGQVLLPIAHALHLALDGLAFRRRLGVAELVVELLDLLLERVCLPKRSFALRLGPLPLLVGLFEQHGLLCLLGFILGIHVVPEPTYRHEQYRNAPNDGLDRWMLGGCLPSLKIEVQPLLLQLVV